MFVTNAYAQSAGVIGSNLMSVLPFILMFAVLYFMVLRPQMKRQKEVKNMLSGLACGDEIITAGGLLGQINKLADQYIIVELASGVEVKMQKSSVTMVLPKTTLKSI